MKVNTKISSGYFLKVNLKRNNLHLVLWLYSILFSSMTIPCFAQITRTQIINNAMPYTTFTWTAYANNCIAGGYYCSSIGRSVYAPTYANSTQRGWVVVGTNTSMPYAWGGWSTRSQYIGQMTTTTNTQAGDICSAGPIGGNCGGLPSVTLSCASGHDCSGLVSRAWDLPDKKSTNGLVTISTEINYSQLQPGDIVNWAGQHTRLIKTYNQNGSADVIEASGTDWKTSVRTYNPIQQTNYTARVYNNVTGVPLPGAFTLTLTPGCNGTTSQITLNWTASSNAITYDVYRNGVLYFPGIIGLQFLNTGVNVTGGTSYSYYVKAQNSAGSTNSNTLSAIAPNCNIIAPTVTTTTATNITTSTATSGGNVTSDGGTSVTARGVCWSTGSNPTIGNTHTSDGFGTGAYVSSLTELSASTTYYYRAYATNSAGTSYGTQYQFTTQPLIQSWVTVVAPNGGEIWQGGSLQYITWSSNNIANVKIEFSTNNGTNWSSLITSAPASPGTYAWTVANTPSTQCKVKISDVSNLAVFGISNSIFEISEFSNYALNGTVTYDNTNNSLLNNINITLKSGGNTVGSSTTDNSGYYSINNVTNGSYSMEVNTNKSWGGVNSTDALFVLRQSNGLISLAGLKFIAADVNNSGTVNSTDALLILRRSNGLDNSFIKGDWVFNNPQTISISGSNVTQDFKGLTVGDVNGSYMPTLAKINPNNIALLHSGSTQVRPNEVFSIPLYVSSNINLGALTLRIKYPTELASFMGAEYPKEGLLVSGKDGVIRLDWANTKPFELLNNQKLLDLKFQDLNKLSGGSKFNIELGEDGELADEAGNVLNGISLSSPTGIKYIPNDIVLYQNFPNPFNPSTKINYEIPDEGHVTLFIYNILGQKVVELVNAIQTAGTYAVNWEASNIKSGLYFYEMRFNAPLKNSIRIHKMLLVK